MFAYENELHWYSQRQTSKHQKEKGVTWRLRDLSPVNVHFSLVLFVYLFIFSFLSFFSKKVPYAHSAIYSFLTGRSCSALWEQVTAFPWHGDEKEVGRCDTPGGSSQQNKTWLDGKLLSSFRGKRQRRRWVSGLDLPSSGNYINVHI